MNREIHSWWSPSLHKHMEIAVYGHYGFALLMFPTAAADYLEYERFSLIDAIAQFIDSGKCKVFSINSINTESWMNSHMHPAHRAIRHQQYNEYVVNEVVPFIHHHCRGRVMTITSGASLGAWHAANILFRRPDLFDGVIAMSGTFDVKIYTDGYYDDNCYFNSPVDYLPNLNDDYYLPLLRQKRHIYIVSGQGAYEGPQHSRRLSEILAAKGIPHELDLWGHDIPHEWWTWHRMLPHYLGSRF
ncbi:esterase [candidate division KSB1 bacterium]|nr:esterase [candidate division KSB1 bacterium]